MTERHKLTWNVAPISRSTLPDGVERTFLPSPDGPLELLVSLPRHYQFVWDSKPPLLFLHGGESFSVIITFGTITYGFLLHYSVGLLNQSLSLSSNFQFQLPTLRRVLSAIKFQSHETRALSSGDIARIW